jgi:hypothetical protein
MLHICRGASYCSEGGMFEPKDNFSGASIRGEEQVEDEARHDSRRGPLHVQCPRCRDFNPARSLRIPYSTDEGARRFYFVKHPDIAWFRRQRRCDVCHEEFFTGELTEALIEELLHLREKEARRRETAFSKVCHDLRARRKWLDTTGDNVPKELAVELVQGSAWWLSHISGTPVRAPSHANRLKMQHCGWSVEFGANWFAAGRALALARERAKSTTNLALQGMLPDIQTVRRQMRAIPHSCVLNVNLDLYDHYPENAGGELVFGTQAIDVGDCESILMRVTGMDDLFAGYKRVQGEE